jgi:hypothetical protein
MADDRRAATNDPVDDQHTVEERRVEREPTETFIERRPVTRRVDNDDVVGNAMAASQLIQTIVWSVVVLVLEVVLLLALHVYARLF